MSKIGGNRMVQEKLRAVFYARVSTAEEEQLKALPKQVEECKDVIASKGWKLVDGYVDEGKSGTKTDGRKAYKKLLEDMQQDKFEIVVVKSQDRLQRNTFDWYRFTDLLNKNGKQLFLYIDNKFYEPSEDALITGIKAILAEEYSRDLSKKLNNANKRRIEKAKAGGAVSAMGNSQMYGYRIIDGKWVIEPDEAKVVKKMYELYLELGSIKKVRDAMNEQGYRNKAGKLFTDEGVGRILKNEKHKGWVILNKYHRNFETKKIDEFPEKEWVIVKDDHEPIVSEELWDKVNDTIKSHLNKGHEKAKGKKYVEYYTQDKVYREQINMKTLWEELQHRDFVYADRSCLVNIEKVIQIHGMELELSGGVRVRIARRHLMELKECVRQYWERKKRYHGI